MAIPLHAGSTRLGLCCQFLDAPIRFRTATHRYVASLAPADGRAYLTAIARDNAAALDQAVRHCHDLGIGAFRINSQILPLATHPVSGYALGDLDLNGSIAASFRAAGALARALEVRLSFHPDQFVVLNSLTDRVVAASVEEMRLQGGIAELVGADVITLHAGGSAGGTEAGLERLERGIGRLDLESRGRLALENDDRRYGPAALLPLCERLGIPLVYDVHHHRCHPDALDVSDATHRAAAPRGGRAPHFHISSPRAGWQGGDPRPHAEYVMLSDFPDAWRGQRLTVDVEAKAKERAVLALAAALADGEGDR
jgi:UV DNA damage endonuclease